MPQSQRREPMVGWYDPRQLMNTGIQVLVSDLIGTRIDARRDEALAAQPDEVEIDYGQTEDLWFDYMADTGDGWDSTYHMAQLVSRSSLQIGKIDLPRGKFLLLGGDEVYPFASKRGYRNRLVSPFEAASPTVEEDPKWDLYAIPGNHDWYDGLVSFLHQFTQGRRIGSWATKQKRSYFAMKLPHRWWLWAVDTQLESDLDQPQVDYFRQIAGKMSGGDRLMVCIPEPDWLYGKMVDDPSLMNNLDFLLNHSSVLGQKNVKVYLTLSGDLHHYRRHEHATDRMRQKIVSGGGGAFLHPTHRNSKISEVNVYGETFRLVKDSQFPKPSTCFWLTFLNLLFPLFNPWFGTLTAPLYLFFGWQLLRIGWSFKFLGEMLITASPLMLALVLLFYIGFYYFSQGGRLFRAVWGATVHGSAHVLAVWWLADLMNRSLGTDLAGAGTAVYRALGLLAGGYLLGGLIMGVYLFVSLNVLGHHHNEAFSSLRIKHYKNFLRLHVKSDGTLDIYPIGVPHLSQPPILIEEPIAIVP